MTLVPNENPIVSDILSHVTSKNAGQLAKYDLDFVELRIKSRMTSLGLTSNHGYSEYIDSNPSEQNFLLDTMTISVSSFFRDALLFEYFDNVILPEIFVDKSKHSFLAWSAGCATGEEPYSLSILLNEANRRFDRDIDINVIGTDIDKPSIDRCKNGIFSNNRVNNVKHRLLNTYFEQEGSKYRVSDLTKTTTQFFTEDLTSPSLSSPQESVFGGFDLIFCSNVLIYFTPSTRQSVLNKLCSSLSVGGFLCLDRCETLSPESKLYQVEPFLPLYKRAF